MDMIGVKLPNGSFKQIPYCQFFINDHQNIAAFGNDFKNGPIEIDKDKPGIKSVMLGRLEDIGMIFQMQIANTLYAYDWDFETYPNPEIILITKEEEL